MTRIPTVRWLLPCLLPCLLAGPVQAGLAIQTLEVFAYAEVQTFGGGGPPVVLYDDQPFALPFVLTATAQIGTQTALALQAKNGYFQNRAAVGFGNGAYAHLVAISRTAYGLTVATDEVNTPLILDFNVFGSLARGSAYYAEGVVNVGAGVRIRAARDFAGPNLPEVWGFSDTVSQGGGIFSIGHTGRDVQGIGLPVATSFVGFEEFQSTAKVERGSFTGTLDFGLLQPGELFTLLYQSESAIDMQDVLYGGSAVATLIDPFALGGEPPLTLRGLALPTAPGSVPEPQTWALMLAALALLVRPRATRGQAQPARTEYPLNAGELQAYR